MPLITDQPKKLVSNRQIEDFPPVTLPEITQMIWNPLLAALQQGMPAEQSAAIPIEAMCRLLHTVKLLSVGQAAAGNLLVEVLNHPDTSDEIKDKINSFLTPDLSAKSEDTDEKA